MALTKVTGDFIKAGSITQGHLHSSHGITTSHIAEGDKLFFTNARVDSRVGSLSTSNLSEGSNLYYTDTRARAAISVSGNALSYNSSTGVITSNFEESPTFTGAVVGSSFSATGGFLNGSNGGIRIHASGTKFFNITAANAARDGVMDIGASDARFKDLYLSGNITAGGNVTVSGGDITLGGTGRIQGIDTVSANTDAANKLYVDNQVAGIVDSAPGTLDTLNELAAALGDDANFSTTVTNSIATKLPLAGGTLTGPLQAQPWLFRSMANQTEYHVLDNGSINGPSWKFRYDGATANRYVDFGYKDGNGTYTAGLKLYNNQTISWRGTDIINSSSQWVGGIASSGYNNSNWDTAYGWGDHGAAGYLTSYTETDTLATVTARGASTGSAVTLTGGSKIVVQNGTDGGTSRGIFMWTNTDANWGIYMSTPGSTNNIGGGTAPSGLNGETSHSIRFRIASNATNGFIWENHNNAALMSLRGSAGDLITSSSMRAPIFYDSGNTAYYTDPASRSILNDVNADEFKITSSSNNARWNSAGDWGTRLYTDAGYIHLGPANTSHAHIYTDRGDFYFNKRLQIDGGTLVNTNDVRTQIFYDSNNTSYYADPHSTSNFAALNVGGSAVWTSGNDGSGSGLDADLLDGKDHTNFGATLATYGTTASSSGRIRCTAPFNTNSGHMFQIMISLYGSYTQHTYIVSAYMYSTTNQWYSPQAVYLGTGSPDIIVGRDSNGKAYISIANGNYMGVRVHNMTRGYQTSVADTYDPWTITVDAGTENSVTPSIYKTWTSGNDGSGSGLDADLLDGQQASAFQPAGSYAPAGGSYGTDWYANALYHDEWVRNHTNNDGHYWSQTGWHLYPKDHDDFFIRSGSGSCALGLTVGNETIRGYLYANTSNQIGFLNSSRNWSLKVDNSGHTYATASHRAPIFYDLDDTSYYVNPNSTTSLRTVGSWRSNSSTWDGEFAGKMQYHSNYWYIQTTNGVYIRNASGANNVTLSANGVCTAANDWRAPQFYDSADTGYYLNPNGTSRLSNINISGAGATGLNLTSTDIRSSATSTWTGNPGANGKIQYHSNRWYIVGDSSSNRIVQFRRDGSDVSYIDNSGRLVGAPDLRAPIFYDANDTNYYLDGNGISRLSKIWCRGSATNSAPRWDTSFHVAQSQHFYGHSSTQTMYIGESNTINIRSTGIASSSFRAPIFYDSGNTGYYLDAGSTSNLNAATFAGNVIGQNAYFGQDVGIGFTSGNIGGNLNIRNSAAGQIAAKIELGSSSNGSTIGAFIHTGASYASSGMFLNFQSNHISGDDNVLICYLDGDLVNKNNSYTQYSDERLKENIVDATPKLNEIKQIKVRNFNFKGEDLKQIGVVAQELEPIFPALVKEREVPGHDNPIKTVKYSVMVPILIKAMQEQQTIIDDLKSRLETLENQ